MISQKNPRLLPILQEVGCYLLTMMEWNQRKYGYQFEPEQVNVFWNKAKKAGWIGDDPENAETYNCILDPDSILMMIKKVATEELGRWKQIGVYEKGKYTYWGWVDDAWKNAEKYYAGVERTHRKDGTTGTHFIDVQSPENPVILYDSMNYTRIGEVAHPYRVVIYALK